MFSAQVSPIAIDFGSSAIKFLQISTDQRPSLVAATEIAVPDSARGDAEKLFAFYTEQVAKVVKSGRFKGKRAVSAVPSGQTLIQHMQVPQAENKNDLVKGQLQATFGLTPDSVVVRAVDVCDTFRGGQARREMICFAVSHEMVMKYIDVMRKARLEVVGMHTETVAMVHAFDHLNRRESDAQVATLYCDLGYSGMRVAVSHGKDIAFARYVPIGGKHIDQHIASSLHCDVPTARNHRMSMNHEVEAMTGVLTKGKPGAGAALLNVAMQAGGKSAKGQMSIGTAVAEDRRVGMTPAELAQELEPSALPALVQKANLGEILDTLTDEILMCLRYHHTLFNGRAINRVIFVGGETRQAWLCQHIVKVLRLSAQLGDPLARLTVQESMETPGLVLGRPQPGWAVACGLCASPTDF
ncbi:MAG TPA: pilus assembly protein PilM [Phycisphaerales bacterium]|nr:pilus assembly protein PilM [Phycisphaerales bacterium]